MAATEGTPMVAVRPFAVYRDGRPVSVRKGTVVSGNDPLIRSHAQFFRPVDSLVEQTTAAPGERRAVILPERVTAKQAAAQAGTTDHRTHTTDPERGT